MVGLRVMGFSARGRDGTLLTIRILILIWGFMSLAYRHDTSAASERPIVLSILTLLWLGLGTLALQFYSSLTKKHHRDRSGLGQIDVESGPHLLTRDVLCAVGCIVARTALVAYVSRWPQCNWRNLHLFVPFVVACFEWWRAQRRSTVDTVNRDSVEAEKALLSNTSKSETSLPRAGSLATLATLSLLLWACASLWILNGNDETTGVACAAEPSGTTLVAAAQVMAYVLDAGVVICLVRARRSSLARSDGKQQINSEARLVATICLMSAAALVVGLNVFSRIWTDLWYWGWAEPVHRIFVKDLLIDSTTLAVCLAIVLSLVGDMSWASWSLPYAAATVFGGELSSIVNETAIELVRAWPSRAPNEVMMALLAVLTCAIGLICSRNDNILKSSSQSASGYSTSSKATVLLFLANAGSLAYLSSTYHAHLLDIHNLIRGNVYESIQWIGNARSSKTFADAAATYTSRHDAPPPPKFDKWYEFAIEHDSQIIDTFDQISADLRIFSGVSPQDLRTATALMLSTTRLGIAGLNVTSGKVEVLDNVPGTHRWMLDGYRSMIEPFAEHLPDMLIAFNIDDECRVAVPFESALGLLHEDDDMQPRSGQTFPARIAAASDKGLNSDEIVAIVDSWFTRDRPRNTYDDFVARTCPPDSPAKEARWSAYNLVGPGGRGVSLGGADDLCKRPDVAQIHGFFLAPGTSRVTVLPLPIFSQGKVSGYNDILVPSPWNFVSKVDLDDDQDPDWEDKGDSLYWRGAGSDGCSTRWAYVQFLRSRFVYLSQLMARKLLASVADSKHAAVPAINVSFVGDFTKYRPTDSESAKATFYPNSQIPTKLEFKEHWQHRYLMDLDGAGFSGRFLPFMRSKSLPFRATIFRTWYDERLHPWRHYVPVDVSLSEMWNLVRLVRNVFVDEGARLTYGERIATDGMKWARQTLRQEDMQVYMFRLLLEYGRLIDDARDELVRVAS